MSQSDAQTGTLPAGDERNGTTLRKSGSLTVAGVAGVLASACCVGPLVLASVGLGSIVAGIVATFNPLRPVFILIALAALGFAGWKIYRRPEACAAGSVCVVPRRDRFYKALFWVVTLIVLALITFPYYVGFLYGEI